MNNMTLKSFTPLLLVLLLSGCKPTDYTNTPVVKDFLLARLPGIENSPVDTVSVCEDGSPKEWRTTILLNDDTLYTYSIDVRAKTVKFYKRTTKAERAQIKYRSDVDWGCLGYYYSQAYSRGYQEYGRYRLHVGLFETTAYTDASWVVSNPFGDTDKQYLELSALAVKEALAAHTKFVPNEKSWGVSSWF